MNVGSPASRWIWRFCKRSCPGWRCLTPWPCCAPGWRPRKGNQRNAAGTAVNGCLQSLKSTWIWQRQPYVMLNCSLARRNNPDKMPRNVKSFNALRRFTISFWQSAYDPRPPGKLAGFLLAFFVSVFYSETCFFVRFCERTSSNADMKSGKKPHWG